MFVYLFWLFGLVVCVGLVFAFVLFWGFIVWVLGLFVVVKDCLWLFLGSLVLFRLIAGVLIDCLLV